VTLNRRGHERDDGEQGSGGPLTIEREGDMKIIEIAIAALIAGLTLTIIHLLAVWGKGRLSKLSEPPWSYIVGMTAISIPYVILLWHWGASWHVYAFVIIGGTGGAPVIIGHIAKKFTLLREENEVLRGGLDELDKRRRMGVSARSAEGEGRKPPWADRMA